MSGDSVEEGLAQVGVPFGHYALRAIGTSRGRPDFAQAGGKDASRLFMEMSRALNDGLFAVNLPRTRGNTTPTSIEEFAETFALHFASAAPRKAA